MTYLSKNLLIDYFQDAISVADEDIYWVGYEKDFQNIIIALVKNLKLTLEQEKILDKLKEDIYLYQKFRD